MSPSPDFPYTCSREPLSRDACRCEQGIFNPEKNLFGLLAQSYGVISRHVAEVEQDAGPARAAGRFEPHAEGHSSEYAKIAGGKLKASAS